MLYAARVHAGFPSPADDFIDKALDLNEHLIAHPAATFFVKVQGDSMIDAGIHPGALLVVDRSLQPRSGSIILAILAFVTELEFHRRHLRHVAAAALLVVLMAGLFVVASLIFFSQPVIAMMG